MIIEVRGIIRFKRDGIEIRKIVVRGKRGDDYKTLIYPLTLLFNRGQIIKFLCDYYGYKPKDIKWAEHVKIPNEK